MRTRPDASQTALVVNRLSTSAGHREEGLVDISTRIRRAPTGQPLEPEIQRRLEGSLGSSLEDVRVHTDAGADSMARDVNAKAFTTGSEIFFRKGEFKPSTSGGFETLAHEVVHTRQQASGDVSGSTVGNMRVSDPSDRFEREASSVARRVASASSTSGAVQRQVMGASRIRRNPAGPAAIQRIGAATELRGVSTDYTGANDERVVQRPDLRNAVQSYGNVLRRLWNASRAIMVLDPTDVAGIRAEKTWFAALDAHGGSWLTPGLNSAALIAMDKTDSLAALADEHSRWLEKAHLQDIVVDEQGNVDAAALAARLVRYDETPEGQGKTLVNIAGGKLKRSATHDTAPGADVDTAGSVTQHSGKGWEIFVVGAAGDIHMAPHKIGKYHHSSLLGGAPVSMAGEMKVGGGTIVTMSNKSGHYRPGPEHFQHFLRTLELQGVALTFTVQGWGVANGTAQDWMNSLNPAEQPELKDTKNVWEFFAGQGEDPLTFLTGMRPAGLGWQLNMASPSHLARPEGAGFVNCTHDEVRQALETKFGPARKKMTKEGQVGVSWL